MKKTVILFSTLLLSLSSYAQSKEMVSAFNNAVEAYNTQDYYGVVSLLEDVAEKEPDFVQAQQMLGESHYKMEQYNDARKYYDRVVKVQPRNYKVLYAIALTYVKEKNEEKAIVALQEVLKVKPNYERARRQLSYLEAETSTANVAKPQQSRGAALKVKNSSSVKGAAKKYANKGVGYYMEKQFEEAALALNKAIEVSSKPSPRLYAYAARSNMHTGEYDIAIELLKKAIARDSDNGSHYYYLSKAYELKGIDNLASKNAAMAKTRGFEGTQETFNNAATKHYNLGIDLYHAKKYVAAVNSYQRAIAENPNRPKYYYNMALALLKMNRTKEAKATLEDCMNVDGTYALAYKLMGDVLYQDKKFRKAASYYTEAITLGEHSYNAYMNVGYCFDKLAVYKKALEHFLEAEKINPNHKEVRFTVAMAYFKVNEIREAKTRFEKIVKEEPKNIRALTNLSTICARVGEFEEGLKYAMAWVKLAPQDGEAYNQVGDMLFNLKRGDEGDKYKRKAKSLGVVRDPHWY